VKAVKAKGDSLQREQLALWFEHVRQLGNPVHAAYLQTALLTGARREELTGLRWADVDFQKSLTIRDKVEGSASSR
jgi:integrase